MNRLVLKIPNLVSRSLYVEQLQDIYLTASDDQQQVMTITDQLFLHGNLQAVCEFIETRLFPILSNRDYRWSNELAIKVIFMTVLFNDRVYMMVSETEVDHGYSDLSLIVRPDMRRFNALDLVLEFKYLNLKELGLTGAELRALSAASLTTITRFAVVAMGLERLVFMPC